MPRHTLENILETRHYTFNHINQDIYRQAHQTSARYDSDKSEFDATGLNPWYSKEFPAPYVAESVVRMGMRYCEHYEIRANQTIMVVGEVREVHLPEQCVGSDGFIDIHRAGTVTVSGLDYYFKADPLERLSYAKPDSDLRRIA